MDGETMKDVPMGLTLVWGTSAMFFISAGLRYCACVKIKQQEQADERFRLADADAMMGRITFIFGVVFVLVMALLDKGLVRR